MLTDSSLFLHCFDHSSLSFPVTAIQSFSLNKRFFPGHPRKRSATCSPSGAHVPKLASPLLLWYLLLIVRFNNLKTIPLIDLAIVPR